jgi:hypothetical protein
MTGEQWQAIDIPKQAMFWSKDNSLSVLSAVCGFYRYVLVELMQSSEVTINRMLISRIEFGNVLMPSVYDEFREQLEAESKFGVDFSFLGINKKTSALTP